MNFGSPAAAIFDVDGTLIDSVDFHARAWVDAFAEFGVPVAFEKVRRQIGKGGDKLMPVFLSKDQLARFGQELDAFRSGHFKRKYLEQLRPFAGVRALFERLVGNGIKIALASSSKPDELQVYKRRGNRRPAGRPNLVRGCRRDQAGAGYLPRRAPQVGRHSYGQDPGLWRYAL